MDLLLFAQDVLPDVDEAINWAERAEKLGTVGLALFFMFLTVGVAWWLIKGKDEEIKGRDENLVTSAEANADLHKNNAKLEKEFREKVEALLREMLERGEDSQEALGSNTQAVRDMTQGMQQLTTRIEYVERTLHRPPSPPPV